MTVPPSGEVRQLTHDAKNHDLDNNLNFSRDGKWLLYDTRNPGIPESKSVEKVQVETGEVVVLYNTDHTPNGPVNGAGAASFSPADDRVVFIHGPFQKPGLPYDFTRRRGGLVTGEGGGKVSFADARDITPPFTLGALRGGTHRHEWDGSGKWLGFTYNDDPMKKAGKDLRTIGVTHLGIPVKVPNANVDLFEGDGEGFSALVVRVVPDPKPGSDEINRAAQDSWVGSTGYQKPDGTHQLARAFVGSLTAANGKPLDELFIVDIPEDITQPGEFGPLEGTESQFPMPPKGCSQRRLTWTEKWGHPGVVGNCWSSPDGSWITFLAIDDNGLPQIFALHPTGGEPMQVTHLAEGVASSPRWSNDGKRLVAASKSGQIFVTEGPNESSGSHQSEPVYLTPQLTAGQPQTAKPVFSPDGKVVAFNQTVKAGDGDWLQVFVVRAE
jgi:WD40 repeat protein